jgi:hypothetical protein
VNGPLLLIRASVQFALTGLRFYTRALGPNRAKILFWGGMAVSALVAIVLQLSGH